MSKNAFFVAAGLLLATLIFGLSRCGGDTPLSAEALLGGRVFFDESLSASGRQSCASCHSAGTGHAAPNQLAVQFGGARMEIQGLRTAPSIRYLARNTEFHFDANGKPMGGFFWDGRANTLAEQAAGPLLNPREMANKDKLEVVDRIANATWLPEFKKLFGEYILQDKDLAFEKLTLVLEKFQQESPALNAYTSKFDAFLRGEASLGRREERGLALFNDPAKGNCASCHPSEKQPDGSHPLFTDFSYDNLGVPRNSEIPENADSDYFDLGLCGREELKNREELCGQFKVPTLRNVVLRKTFFHNGKFKDLKEALTFYVQRDTHPEKWYSFNMDGTVRKFDDLPEKWHGNVNVSEVPYNKKPGEQPSLSDSEIDDILVFLNTLTDGWKAE